MAKMIISTEQGNQLAIERIAQIPLPITRPIGVATHDNLAYVTISHFVTAPNTRSQTELAIPGILAVIDDTTQTVLQYASIGHAPRYVAVDPGTQRIFVTHNTTPGHLTVLDGTATPPTIIKTIEVGRNPLGVAICGPSNRVYLAHAVDAKLTILDAISLEILGEIFLEHGIHLDRIAVDAETNRIFVPALNVSAPSHTPWLYVVDGDAFPANTSPWTKVVLASDLSNGAAPRTVAIDTEHKRIYVANFSNATNSVSVLQLTPPQLLATVKEPGSLAADVAVDSKKNLVYVSNSIVSSLSSIGIGMSVLDGETMAFFQPPSDVSQPEPKEPHGSWELGIVGPSHRVYIVNPDAVSVSVVETSRVDTNLPDSQC